MKYQEKITADLRTAMKARQSDKVLTLRLLIAAFENARIEKGKDLQKEDEVKILSSEAKKRKESIEAYEKAGRKELADKEEQELQIIEEYLPKQMNKEEVLQFIKELKEWESVKGDFGQAMKLAMSQLRGKADGKVVSEAVQELL